jgi:hypothetical protein
MAATARAPDGDPGRGKVQLWVRLPLAGYAIGGAASLAKALAPVGGPATESSAAPVAVSPSDVVAYTQLRANVRVLIASYAEIAALFASSFVARLDLRSTQDNNWNREATLTETALLAGHVPVTP